MSSPLLIYVSLSFHLVVLLPVMTPDLDFFGTYNCCVYCYVFCSILPRGIDRILRYYTTCLTTQYIVLLEAFGL